MNSENGGAHSFISEKVKAGEAPKTSDPQEFLTELAEAAAETEDEALSKELLRLSSGVRGNNHRVTQEARLVFMSVQEGLEEDIHTLATNVSPGNPEGVKQAFDTTYEGIDKAYREKEPLSEGERVQLAGALNNLGLTKGEGGEVTKVFDKFAQLKKASIRVNELIENLP